MTNLFVLADKDSTENVKNSRVEGNLKSSTHGAIPKARAGPSSRNSTIKALTTRRTINGNPKPTMATPTAMTSLPGPAPFDDDPQAQQERDACDYDNRITLEQAR